MLFGWSLEIWLLTGAVCVLAGAVRGFTGFGLALILVMAAALWMPPAQIVPIALILDLFAGIRMLPHVHRDIDRPGVALMTLGAVPAIPVGIYLLAVVPEPTMRLAIGVVVLAAVIAIAAGLGLKQVPGRGLKVTTGVFVGLLTGAAGIPGPPVILLYLSSPLPAAMLRAMAVALFLATDTLSLIGMSWAGLIKAETLWRCLLLAPLVEVGVLIGRRLYGVADPVQVKRAALALLAVLAIVAIARALLE